MERLQKIGRIAFRSAAEVRSSRLGIGFEKLDRDLFDPERAYDKVAAIGVKKIRLQSGWMKTEREKGVYDFAWLDTIVDNLLRRGMEPWLTLCYGNPLYTPLAVPVFGAVGCPPVGTAEETAAWLRYVEATVRHFKGRVSLYEIWNEPDAWYSWRHVEGEEPDLHRNALEYGQFAIATADAIHRADPGARAMGFALGRPVHLAYVHDALSTGMAEHVDCVSYHNYSVQPVQADRIAQFTELVHQFRPDMPIVQGEGGAQTRSTGAGALKGFAWTETRQMTHLLRILLRDLAAGVEFTSYFTALDMVEALHGRVDDRASCMDYGYFGVLSAEFDENGRATGEYGKKPSYYALSALAALFAGDARSETLICSREVLPSRRVDGNDFEGRTLETHGFRLEDGTRALAYWNDVPVLTETYDGTVSFTVCCLGQTPPTLIDLRTGDRYALPPEMTETLPSGDLLLKNLPLREFPLLLQFGA